MNDYVSQATATLLQMAGYSQDTGNVFYVDGELQKHLPWDTNLPKNRIPAPTLWNAMKWFRDEKQIAIIIDTAIWGKDHGPYFRAKIIDIEEYVEFLKSIVEGGMKMKTENRTEDYPSYEDACDAGIAAACEWLLKT